MCTHVKKICKLCRAGGIDILIVRVLSNCMTIIGQSNLLSIYYDIIMAFMVHDLKMALNNKKTNKL